MESSLAASDLRMTCSLSPSAAFITDCFVPSDSRICGTQYQYQRCMDSMIKNMCGDAQVNGESAICTVHLMFCIVVHWNSRIAPGIDPEKTWSGDGYS
jgi:hypothetical protein